MTDVTCTLRWATRDDYPALADVMFDAVRNGISEYTEAQREQWVPERRGGADWADRLSRQAIIVAETADEIVGFMSLADGGYIDFAYVRPAVQGRGVFKRLYREIEKHSRKSAAQKLWVHASLMARPAFAAVGFSLVEAQVVAIGNERFERFKMELKTAA
jgi:putative acetyltransferase